MVKQKLDVFYLYSKHDHSLIILSLSSLQVRTIRMHMYTLIQVSQFPCTHITSITLCMCVCVCVQVVLVSLLWGLKLSPAGMIYPVAIVGLVPMRWLLSRYIFTHTEMEAVSLGQYVLILVSLSLSLLPTSLQISLSLSLCSWTVRKTFLKTMTMKMTVLVSISLTRIII